VGDQAEVRAGAPTGDRALKVRVRPVAAAAGKAETAVLIGFPFRSCGRSRAVGGVNLDDSRLPPPTRPPLKPLRYPPQLLKSRKKRHRLIPRRRNLLSVVVHAEHGLAALHWLAVM
jgi:hypothetical protein